jgi:FKBP-type peptidyl-prolyl cis-trans isomerase
MGLSKVFRLSFLLLIFHGSTLIAEPISIKVKDPRDYAVLDRFFRMGVEAEEYGYVLEGEKPISIRNFYSLDYFPMFKDPRIREEEFINGLMVRETIPIWNRLCSSQQNFVLKAVSLDEPGAVAPGLEVQFINISKLREVIDKSIDLFRYVLGPTTETTELVEESAHSKAPLFKILKNDLTLVGIVLGFGSYNSLVGGRMETIESNAISRDCAPFLSKGSLMKSDKSLTPQNFGVYFLEFAGRDDSFFRSCFSNLQPSKGFSSLENEVLILDGKKEPLPSSLYQKPAFIFGAFKGGPSNQPLFDSLLRTQKKIQALLREPDFLEIVLEKVGGEKPSVTCDRASSSRCNVLFQTSTDVQKWINVLRSVSQRFQSQEEQAAFFNAFMHPSTSSRGIPKMIAASKAMLDGLKKARHNLAKANGHFEAIAKDKSLQVVAKNQLYFKTTVIGSGKELKNEDRIRVGYTIEDQEGNVLFADCDTWLNLSQTIPGFAHGVKGMKMGERRTIFVHPALAYGVFTTLPPCIDLVIKVNLIDVDISSSGKLLSMTALDLNLVQDNSFFQAIEGSLRQFPCFVGAFYRDMVDKIDGLEKTIVISELDQKMRLSKTNSPRQ